MSDLPQISPLMDGLSVLERIAAKDDSRVYLVKHDAAGVRCIVKHISVPASSIDTNALILTGAVQSDEEAHAYYESIVNSFREELAAFRQLIASPYLCSYARFQVVAKEGAPGFDIYLLAPQRTSLKVYLEQNAISTKMALQMATDLCRGLIVLRKHGFIHQNLKPENIFYTNDGVFSIGDFGLTSCEDLQHAAIPAKNVGAFTAPEACQSSGTLNLTSDIYSVGMLLYYIYNGNHAAFEEANSTKKYAESRRIAGEELPAPIYADYEMDAIIRKACAIDPADRYQTPEELLAALEAYVETIQADDTSVVPPLVVDDHPLDSAAGEDEDEDEDELFAPLSREPISEDFRESFRPATEEDKKPRKKHLWLPILLSVLVLLGAAFCYYYFELSAVTVDSITVIDKGTDYLTLAVDATDLDALMITCAPDGEEGITYYCDEEVTFSNLKPGTMYTIMVDTIDFRYLHGTQGGTAVTASITEVLTFNVADNGNGTYSANFTVSGPEPEAWILTVSAEGREPMVFSAKNHSCELTGLLPNTDYMLTLDTGAGYHLTGLTATTFSYAQPITGSDLQVEEVTADSITVVWAADSDAETVWNVVCSGDNGYAATLEVEECRAVFEGTSVSAEYTIAVSNDYMTMPLLLTVDCPAATVSEITASVEGTSATVSWTAEGPAVPESWVLIYGIETMETMEEITVTGNHVTVENLLPGAEYLFRLTDPNGSRITGTMETSGSTEPAAEYADPLPAMFPGLFSEPKTEDWDSTMLAGSKLTFAPAEPIVFALEPIPKPNAKEEPTDVEVMLIIRNEDGSPMSYSVETMSWDTMWVNKLFAAYIGTVPDETGNYTIELYFDGQIVKTMNFKIAD